jgi:hypothetical protein
MKKTLIGLAAVLVLGACGGSDHVVTIDGVSLDLDDVPVSSESSTIDDDTFRNALNWVIRDRVLVAAAEDEFGITFTEAELTDRATMALGSLNPAEQDDPRANLDYFLIQARVGLDGLLWPQVNPLLPDGLSQNEWAIEKLLAADVEVDTRYGEWRVDPEPLVYEP